MPVYHVPISLVVEVKAKNQIEAIKVALADFVNAWGNHYEAQVIAAFLTPSPIFQPDRDTLARRRKKKEDVD